MITPEQWEQLVVIVLPTALLLGAVMTWGLYKGIAMFLRRRQKK